jgi:hypothetical protein
LFLAFSARKKSNVSLLIMDRIVTKTIYPVNEPCIFVNLDQ